MSPGPVNSSQLTENDSSGGFQMVADFDACGSEYKFYKEVVLRRVRCIVSNPESARVQRAFRHLLETVAATGDMDELRKHRRKWHRREIEAFRALDAAADMEAVLLETDAVDRKFTPQIWMLSLELLYALVLLVVCVFQEGRHLDTAFKAYEARYFTFVNSCTSVGFVVNAGLRVLYAGNGRPGFFVFASVALVLPVFLMHIVPGFFVFIWLPALVVPASAAILVGAQRLKRRGLGGLGIPRERLEAVETPVFLLVNVVTRVTATFAVTLMFQTLFNYMVLFYHRDEMGLSYGDIIHYEYISRRWDCLWEKWFEDATKALQVWSTFV